MNKKMIFMIPEEIENKLRALSKEKGLTLSDLVRRAIELYFDKVKGGK
jgi:predicted DNA-binding protein